MENVQLWKVGEINQIVDLMSEHDKVERVGHPVKIVLKNTQKVRVKVGLIRVEELIKINYKMAEIFKISTLDGAHELPENDFDLLFVSNL